MMLLDIHRCSGGPELKQCLLCGTHKAIPHNVTAVERAARIMTLPSSIPLATIAAAITKDRSSDVTGLAVSHPCTGVWSPRVWRRHRCRSVRSTSGVAVLCGIAVR